MAGKRTQNGSTPPNALSRSRVARQVAGRLAMLQEQKLELELVQTANDAEPTDPVPGIPPKQEDGQIVYENGQIVFPSYAERYAELDAAIARVVKHGEALGVMKLVEGIIALDEEQEAVS